MLQVHVDTLAGTVDFRIQIQDLILEHRELRVLYSPSAFRFAFCFVLPLAFLDSKVHLAV